MTTGRRKRSSYAQRGRTRHSAPDGNGAPTPAGLPQRPGPAVLSEAIPLFFIGRNKDGLWVARDADGWIGGIFLLKRSALRFAKNCTPPWGCATMDVPEGFELDIQNSGNQFVARFAATALRLYRHFEPRLSRT